jgi:hypothetical protein
MANGFISAPIAQATGNFGKHRQREVNQFKLQNKEGAKDSNHPMGILFITQKVSVSQDFGKSQLQGAKKLWWWMEFIRGSGRCWTAGYTL